MQNLTTIDNTMKERPIRTRRELEVDLSPEVKKSILANVEGIARGIFKEMPLLPVHDITHVERVVRYSDQICEGESVDPFFSRITAWLHDIGRLPETQNQDKTIKIFHAEESAKALPGILEPFKDQIGANNVELIRDAVARHSLKNAEDDSLLARILKDADRLDGIGAIAGPRVFAFYPERPIYNPVSPLGGTDTSEQYLRYSGQSTQIEAFKRNLEWFGMLRVPTAIELGIPKAKWMLDFLYQFGDEVGIPKKIIDQDSVVTSCQKRLSELEIS